MKIFISGATGRTGHMLVEKALREGHDVVVYARNPQNMRITHSRLSVVRGSMADAPAIAEALAGVDVVIEGVGSMSEGTRAVIAAMRKAKVKRLVVVSTCSVDDPHDLPDMKRKALVAFVKKAVPEPYSEVRKAAELVRASSLDWTLVRVARLTNKPAKGAIKVGYYGHNRVGLTITREDMATFLLRQATDATYVHQAPAISN